MASTTKRARFLINDTNAVLEMLDEEGSDNKGMSRLNDCSDVFVMT